MKKSPVFGAFFGSGIESESQNHVNDYVNKCLLFNLAFLLGFQYLDFVGRLTQYLNSA
ncbi:hypothetical protein COO91_10561 (plasmid) [Nostoc flagelliforme CCNUN1]|uniref:Uncharacterized protein n=1 Tax=Nostoc flagelliforme CCNUN1 TaxID=2038116 RepID=A0A2K8T9G9_9NOSO|nr:hypothetical protein COO91_10561 [Nostoc flagelliforme CCNUN1]